MTRTMATPATAARTRPARPPRDPQAPSPRGTSRGRGTAPPPGRAARADGPPVRPRRPPRPARSPRPRPRPASWPRRSPRSPTCRPSTPPPWTAGRSPARALGPSRRRAASSPGTPGTGRSPTARPSGSPPAPASRRAPPPCCAASTAVPSPTTADGCDRHADDGGPHRRRTSGRAARSAAAATSCCRSAPLVTPAVLGLAAAAGYDDRSPPSPAPASKSWSSATSCWTAGCPHDGRIRDALGPMLPPWLRALGAEVIAVRRLGDDADALHRPSPAPRADLVVTTGGTAAGPVDHVHPMLRRIGADCWWTA